MTSPFHETPGPQTYGDYVFEWRTLLNTPCYGFSGPNACLSTTCDHNPSLSETEKQLTKPKMPNSYKFYAKKSLSNCERAATDYSTYKSSLTKHLTVQTTTHSYRRKNTYEDYGLPFSGDEYYVEEPYEYQPFCDDSPIVETKDFNELCESPDYYYHPVMSNSPETFIEPAVEECTFEDSSHEIVVSAKQYTFNPLSEPFHPMRNIYSNASSSPSLTADSSEYSSIASSTTTTPTLTPEPTKPIERKKTEKFICILCPEKYDTLDELQEHLKNKVQQPHTCVICGVTFEHNYLLHRHVKQHRHMKSFQCRCCHKKFRSLNQLGKHFDFCRYKLYMFI